ncbi:hypothetical protein [Fischerella sp. PCC 9605]|uniref:hypothetical protein n=1 Tax=Fischerella sp. PCC 9605 TaxID=1173024 RepID=UPI000478FFED|nr:hypothetical protein [Fischerella sp. PCC 9605]
MSYLLSPQLQLLSAPETLTAATVYRFLVELVSSKVELDERGKEVPVIKKIVDVRVIEPSYKAIREILKATGNLEGFQINHFWIPADQCPF